MPVAHAQTAGAVAVSFRNDLKIPVIVQGFTVVNGMTKAGMALVVMPGKTLTDNNVPSNSVRYYRIVDANRPMMQYIRNLPVRVVRDDINLAIHGMPPNVGVKKAAP